MKTKKYSIEAKLSGLDLHGLPCRIPKPTKQQAACSHTECVTVDRGHEDWDGVWQSEERQESNSTYEEIPGTSNLRCTRCAYTRRY